MRQLSLLRDGVKTDEFQLDLPDVIIGRGRSAHIRLDENSIVSRQHAVVRERGEGHVVEDLGGANGTWVNGYRVDVHTLRPGDHIVLGPDTLRYDFGLPSARSLRADAAPLADQTALTGDNLEAIEELDDDHLSGVEDLATVREARRQDPPSPLMAGGLHPGGERTAVASKDEIERLLKEMALKQGPHLVLVGSDPEVVFQLGDGQQLIGHVEGCHVRLPGRRWFFGKLAARLVKQAVGWCVVPEATFWNPVHIADQPITRLRQLSDGDVVVFRSASYRFSRGEQR